MITCASEIVTNESCPDDILRCYQRIDGIVKGRLIENLNINSAMSVCILNCSVSRTYRASLHLVLLLSLKLLNPIFLRSSSEVSKKRGQSFLLSASYFLFRATYRKLSFLVLGAPHIQGFPLVRRYHHEYQEANDFYKQHDTFPAHPP